MKSPFPGMDPYIEACGLWEDSATTSSPMPPSSWQTWRRIDTSSERESLPISSLSSRRARRTIPFYPMSASPRRTVSRKAVKRAAPPSRSRSRQKSRTFCAPHRDGIPQRFIEIYETAPEMRLVTTLEVLSPSNKRHGTPGWDLFRRKRQGVLLGDVNFVEIDLLRGGRRMPMLDPWPNSPYTLMVMRAKNPQLCRVWEASFQSPLPIIPVPLAKPDPDILLSLQPILDTIYQRFRYAQSINYAAELTPPLSAEESAWCRHCCSRGPAARDDASPRSLASIRQPHLRRIVLETVLLLERVGHPCLGHNGDGAATGGNAGRKRRPSKHRVSP